MSDEELIAFDERVTKGLCVDKIIKYVAELKMDGLAGELVYENGTFEGWSTKAYSPYYACWRNNGDNTLDGGTGADTIYSGNGSDTIVIRSGDGGSSITDADIIADFTDGSDLIGMSGLNYSELTIEQGTGSYSSHVIVKKTDTGEYLIIIQNTNLSNIDDNDFTAI